MFYALEFNLNSISPFETASFIGFISRFYDHINTAKNRR